MKNLFFSPQQGILFFIVSCPNDGQVSKVISDLTNGAQTVASVAKVPIECVEVETVTGPSKSYSSMKVFCVRISKFPGQGLELGPDWTKDRIIKEWV